MEVLIFFAFIAGVVTILSPCILPVLPIILSGSSVGSKKYPLGVISGFIISFTIFTLFLTTFVKLVGLDANFLRYLSIVIIFIFGLILVVPKLKFVYEVAISSLQSRTAKKSEQESDVSGDSKKKTGFLAGFLVGVSLGLIWTPCVGPILASVTALALSGAVSGTAVLVTFSYAVGTALPMIAIMYGGRGLINSVPWLNRNLENIQRIFGVLLIVVAVGILFNWDRQFQIYILKQFPSYGTGLTQVETNETVFKAIDQNFNAVNVNEEDLGKLMPNLMDSMYKQAPLLIPGGEWFNSDPLTLEQLRGKVVLVDFWTYSCINCIRTLPYIESWYEKYKDQGLVIIGVHTPEFEFEKDPNNLAKAIVDFGLTYPIVQDNDFATWKAYNNHYWPAKYFIDSKGRLRDMHFGEGDYAESEQLIRDLLKEAGSEVTGDISAKDDYNLYSRTAETYLGYSRIMNFGSQEKIVVDKEFVYSLPFQLRDNDFAYGGEWMVSAESADAGKDAELLLNFEAKDVYLVMSPINTDVPGKVEVYLDDSLVLEFAGDDVVDGTLTVNDDRLYKLVHLDTPGRHLLKLKFLDGNSQVYAFTFG